MFELWKDVEGYEGKYQVSNLGRVKSLNFRNTNTSKIMSLNDNGYGYLVVSLRKDGKRESKYVHRLVAQAFIENKENKPQVNHIDEDKRNNCVDNLEWVTGSENINHGTRNIRDGLNKKTGVIGINISSGYIIGFNSFKESKDFSFNPRCISHCVSGRNKTHKGFRWMYDKDITNSNLYL